MRIRAYWIVLAAAWALAYPAAFGDEILFNNPDTRHIVASDLSVVSVFDAYLIKNAWELSIYTAGVLIGASLGKREVETSLLFPKLLKLFGRKPA